MAKYDVFLSHNALDKPAIEELARQLADKAGLMPFLDKWHLVPGQPWQESIEAALDQSNTCAVFLGPEGLGTWENEEMRTALEIRKEKPDYRVIPVLLPNSKLPERGHLPRFLARLEWIDFRPGLDDPEAFHRLVCGIKGISPGRLDNLGKTSICPFRGLQAFDEEHALYFFGREALTQHLVEKLREQRFLAVLGPSGSGKSSVVRAGLVPQIRKGKLPGSKIWPIILMRPSDHPLEFLASHLLPHVSYEATRNSLLDHLQNAERGLHSIVHDILANEPDSQRLVLVVDQFEEIFTVCQDKAVRTGFINNILYASAIAGGRTLVVVTMRADFFGHCAAYPELATRLSERVVLVEEMQTDELRQAIEAPAGKVGLNYEKGLVDTMLKDLGQEPGLLPLLQYTLLELWKEKQGNWLTIDAYYRFGGIRGTLAQRADELYKEFNPTQQKIVQRVLLRLTQPGEGTEDTRRPAKMAELLPARTGRPDAETVLGKLIDAHLLVTGKDGQDQEIVNVVHEALIRGWPRLQKWLDENRKALQIHLHLTEAAQEWDRNDRDSSYLYQGMRLRIAEEWAETHADALSSLEQEFLKKSLLVRRLKDALWLTAKLGTVLVIVGILVMMITEIGPFARDIYWSSIPLSGEPVFENVEITQLDWGSDDTLYAGLGEGDTASSVACSDDGGETWEFLDLKGQFVYALLVNPYHPDVIYVSLGPDGLFRSQNGGESWTLIGSDLPLKAIEALTVSPDGRLYAGASTQSIGVYMSTDQGETWRPLPRSPQLPIFFLKWVDDRLLVGTDQGLWQQTAAGEWTHLIDEAVYIYSAVSIDGVIFAGGNGIFELRDGIITRRILDQDINNIDIIEGVNPLFIASTVNGEVLQWHLEEEINLLAERAELGGGRYIYIVRTHPSKPGRFWVGTSDGLQYGQERRWFEIWSR